ncbi:MAG: DNA-3-methyladenine glycosylase I [Bacteroidales bacterium]|nr:DNA-3-methyladenine glycosylase I [Candidatus Latescibacterota bacterium]
MKKRCDWAETHPLLTEYHDSEWGVPQHDDIKLFEFLVLDAAQAGLSWLTVLKRREGYRKAFDGFDPVKVAKYTEKKIEALLTDEGIIRNRQKVGSAVHNARSMLLVQEEFGSFDRYIWQFTDGRTLKNAWKMEKDIPAESDESRAMSKDMKKRGFKFVGPVICYAFMQAAGMVNDHLTTCFRYREI